MGINKLKIVVSVLTEMSEGNIPCEVDYDIQYQAYGDIIEAMQDEGLIKNADIKRAGLENEIQLLRIDNAKVTIRGMEYLNENSPLMKTYKGLKEVREWLPF